MWHKNFDWIKSQALYHYNIKMSRLCTHRFINYWNELKGASHDFSRSQNYPDSTAWYIFYRLSGETTDEDLNEGQFKGTSSHIYAREKRNFPPFYGLSCLVTSFTAKEPAIISYRSIIHLLGSRNPKNSCDYQTYLRDNLEILMKFPIAEFTSFRCVDIGRYSALKLYHSYFMLLLLLRCRWDVSLL